MTTLLLIRHGQSEANLQERFAGHYDSPLTDLGHAQARRTAAFIAENYTPDAIYSSDLCRARQTAEHTAALLGLPVTDDPGLREINAGQWEGKGYTTLQADFHDAYYRWWHDIGNACCTGGESVAQLTERVWEAVERIAKENDGKTVVIATHATPIRTLLWKTTGKPLSQMQDIHWVSNASVTELVYRDGALHPVKISQDAHLQQLKTVLSDNV